MRFALALIRNARDERGAYAILLGIVLVVMFGMAAIMTDLTGLRADARSNRTVADFAATSAALDLNPVFGGSPHAACISAWAYFLANTPDAPDNAPDPCAPFAGLPSCDPLAVLGDPINPYEQIEATGTAGPYEVTIAHPVPNGSEFMQGRFDPDIDAGPCERVAVWIERTRGFVFGPVLNSNSGRSNAAAVARSATNTGEGEGVALVILDPVGCNALNAKGQGGVEVMGADDRPGIITVDSAATHSSNDERDCVKSQSAKYAIDPDNNQNNFIHALPGQDDDGSPISGVIFSFALRPGQGNTRSYEDADVAAGRLSPRPRAGERVTRSPIDWRYNCKLENLCPWTDTNGAYIDQLRDLAGGTETPGGWSVYPDDLSGRQCNMPASAAPLSLTGNWFINCQNGWTIRTTVTVTGGNIISRGGINVADGSLTFNQGTGVDRWIYLRSGSFEKGAQASLTLDRTFVYIDNGIINLGAGSGALVWISPVAGDFEDLALWSESMWADNRQGNNHHQLGGQASLNVVGTFFIPNDLFLYTGQGNQTMEQAQFVVWRMEVKGQGVLRMIVDPNRSTLIPLLGVMLIR